MSTIAFFEKNFIDITRDNVTITITDAVASNTGQDFVNQLRDRKNFTGWGTTESTDAANTEILVDIPESAPLTDIFLIKQNFKSYTIQYWNGSSFVDFSPAINVSNNSQRTKRHSFAEVIVDRVKIVVNSTMTTDDDKLLAQLVLTQMIGQFERFPKIVSPTISKRRRTLGALSGKAKVMQSLGSFSVGIEQDEEYSNADLQLIDLLYSRFEGFLVWLSGGNENQFRIKREGYRLEDLYFMAITNENVPEMIEGFYYRGQRVNITLSESL
jgi:hypothetical protein